MIPAHSPRSTTALRRAMIAAHCTMLCISIAVLGSASFCCKLAQIPTNESSVHRVRQAEHGFPPHHIERLEGPSKKRSMQCCSRELLRHPHHPTHQKQFCWPQDTDYGWSETHYDLGGGIVAAMFVRHCCRDFFVKMVVVALAIAHRCEQRCSC